MHTYTFGHEQHFIPEVQKKIYWEVQIDEEEVRVVQRGGPLEPIILTIKGTDLEVSDWWGAGAG